MSEDREGARLRWVCVKCGRPCGDRYELGAMVQGEKVTCLECWAKTDWEEAWQTRK